MRIDLSLQGFFLHQALLFFYFLDLLYQFFDTVGHPVKLPAEHTQLIPAVFLELQPQISLLHLRHGRPQPV